MNSTKPTVVLDTNAVLDWLVFADGGIAQLAQAIMLGKVDWIATQVMRDEFDRVLSYPALAQRGTDVAAMRAAWLQHARMQPVAPACGLECSDSDDQKFIDLALDARASMLVSKDKALLALKKKALLHGVIVCRPEHVLLPALRD